MPQGITGVGFLQMRSLSLCVFFLVISVGVSNGHDDIVVTKVQIPVLNKTGPTQLNYRRSRHFSVIASTVRSMGCLPKFFCAMNATSPTQSSSTFNDLAFLIKFAMTDDDDKEDDDDSTATVVDKQREKDQNEKLVDDASSGEDIDPELQTPSEEEKEKQGIEQMAEELLIDRDPDLNNLNFMRLDGKRKYKGKVDEILGNMARQETISAKKVTRPRSKVRRVISEVKHMFGLGRRHLNDNADMKRGTNDFWETKEFRQQMLLAAKVGESNLSIDNSTSDALCASTFDLCPYTMDQMRRFVRGDPEPQAQQSNLLMSPLPFMANGYPYPPSYHNVMPVVPAMAYPFAAPMTNLYPAPTAVAVAHHPSYVTKPRPPLFKPTEIIENILPKPQTTSQANEKGIINPHKIRLTQSETYLNEEQKLGREIMKVIKRHKLRQNTTRVKNKVANNQGLIHVKINLPGDNPSVPQTMNLDEDEQQLGKELVQIIKNKFLTSSKTTKSLRQVHQRKKKDEISKLNKIRPKLAKHSSKPAASNFKRRPAITPEQPEYDISTTSEQDEDKENHNFKPAQRRSFKKRKPSLFFRLSQPYRKYFNAWKQSKKKRDPQHDSISSSEEKDDYNKPSSEEEEEGEEESDEKHVERPKIRKSKPTPTSKSSALTAATTISPKTTTMQPPQTKATTIVHQSEEDHSSEWQKVGDLRESMKSTFDKEDTSKLGDKKPVLSPTMKLIADIAKSARTQNQLPKSHHLMEYSYVAKNNKVNRPKLSKGQNKLRIKQNIAYSKPQHKSAHLQNAKFNFYPHRLELDYFQYSQNPNQNFLRYENSNNYNQQYKQPQHPSFPIHGVWPNLPHQPHMQHSNLDNWSFNRQYLNQVQNANKNQQTYYTPLSPREDLSSHSHKTVYYNQSFFIPTTQVPHGKQYFQQNKPTSHSNRAIPTRIHNSMANLVRTSGRPPISNTMQQKTDFSNYNNIHSNGLLIDPSPSNELKIQQQQIQAMQRLQEIAKHQLILSQQLNEEQSSY